MSTAVPSEFPITMPLAQFSLSEDCGLRSTQHASLSAFCLPAELLIIIFDMVRRADPWSVKCMLKASHVCRRWRTLALDCPMLWTSVVHTKECKMDNIEDFMQRSGDLPLELRIHRENLLGPWADPELGAKRETAFVQRVTRLHVICVGETLSIPFITTTTLIDLTASAWRNISSLSVIDPYYKTRRTTFPLKFILPRATEKLQFLYMHGLRPQHWREIACRNLQTLHLEDLVSWPTSDELLDALEACPALQTLEISHSVREQAVFAFTETQRIVRMPYLKQLSVWTGPCALNGTFMPLIESLELPVCTHVRLEGKAALTAVAKGLSPVFDQATTIHLSTPMRSIEVTSDTNECDIRIKADFKSPILFLNQYLSHVAYTLRSTSLRLMTIAVGFSRLIEISKEDWDVFFRSFPNLATFSIQDCHDLRMIMPIDNNQSLFVLPLLRSLVEASPDERPLLPSLRSLTIVRTCELWAAPVRECLRTLNRPASSDLEVSVEVRAFPPW
ncbi:hypothetical protein EIP91_012382 [Steccherinum ochraceum]|uniref:F-box domain-containing protein n=1 Tax=Steccherinum ochraceum TaxID=92696 RepID=A0A4R0RGA0_9APHY|nr:hypothetical protein EIP91_012382 [Steccherinum ochraceum]